MTRVAVDATPTLGARTGIGVAVTGMLRALATRPELDLVAYGLTFAGRKLLASAVPPGVGLPAGGRGRVPMVAGALVRVWDRGDWPPVEWWTGRVDVVHGTNFVVPPSTRAARVVSVWDLTALRFPELCTPAARRYPALVRRAILGGAVAHTASRAVADEIVELLGAPGDRVRVIPPGIDRLDGPGRHLRSRGLPSRGPPYVLGLGTVEPRKDFPGLVRAFDLLAGRDPDVELRIAGPSGWGEADLAKAISTARHRDRIMRTGWVADTAALIAGAAVLAFPSLYEGFGYPPLEAMALGVPGVATAVGAVPEVVGDAALLVAPGDPDALADALGRVLTDPAERDRLVEAGRRRLERFGWDAAAAALAALYQELAGG